MLALRALGRTLLACLALAASVRADVLVLRDGQIFPDHELERAEGGVNVLFPSGKVLVPDALVHLVLLEGEPEPEPGGEEERAKLAKGLVPFEGNWISKKRRDELIAKRVAVRKAEVQDNLAHREWKDRRKVETKNFRFEYTVPQHVFEEYAERMEAYFQAFAKEWRLKPPKDGKPPVCFYSSQKEYYRTSGAPRGAVAYFKYGGGYELNSYYERLDPTYTEQVLFHEANHYLQKLINENFSYPHWPGEALAEYYGASRWDAQAKKLTVGLVQEGRLAEIQDDIAAGEWMPLLRILKDGQYEDYTWGWSLVHFLMNDARHAAAFKRFFLALANAQDVERTSAGGFATVAPDDLVAAFRKYLGLRSDEQVSALERDWHRFVQETLLANLSTRGLEMGAFKAMATDRKLRAKRLFQEAIEAGSTNAQLYHKYAQLLLSEDRPKAIENWHRAVELAPLTGSFWFALGGALEKSDPAEAKRLKSLAREIDPELDEGAFDWE
jgi:hypothetical protein